MTSPPNVKSTAVPSITDLVAIEPKVNELSLIFIDEEDMAFTTGKVVKISKNIWGSLSQDGQYYLLCHEAGHYLEGHNRSANRLFSLAIVSLILIPFAGGITAAGAALTSIVAFGTMGAYHGQWVMSREYQADDRGYRLLEQMHAGAYLRGMEETNRFHKKRDKERLSGAALEKNLAMREKHLALKQAKLKATQKSA